MRRPLLPLVLAAALAGCGDKIPTPWSKTEGRQEVVVDPSTGQRVDPDAGPVTTAAPGSGGGAGAAAPGVDCATDYEGTAGTTIAHLECGSAVLGSTGKGALRWGDDFYQRAFCTPQRNRYDDAPEATYQLEVPENTQAEVTLDSPCAELDLVAVAWQLDGVPTVDHVNRIRECEMDAKSGGGHVTLTTVDKAQQYLVAVDGKNGDEGSFRLTVSCRTFR